MIFMGVILQKTLGVSKSHEIFCNNMWHLDL